MNALEHTAGNIEKAQIRISTYNVLKESKLQVKDIVPAKGAAGGLGGIAEQSGLGAVSGESIGQALGAAAGAAAGAAGAVAGLAGSAVKAVSDRLTGNVKTYTVQFNPSQLTLSGYGGGMYQKTDYGTAGAAKKQQKNIGISYEPAKVRLMMNVTLIFDQVSVKDAFMADKFAASPTGAATGTVSLIKEAVTGEEYSVQPIIEGFIGMLRQERTRFVAFCWGAMQYEGIVNSLTTRYTMFSLSGQPIRGEVDMSMILVDEEVGPNNMGVWKTHYEEAFGGGNVSYKNKTQYVGNLLNL